MKKLLSFVASLALLSAQADAATLGVTPGTGATLGQGVDGSGNLLNATVFCGATATVTLYAVCVNQAIVNASGQFLTLTTLTGTLPAFAATPTVNLGTIGTASTAALQTTGNTALTTINTTLGTPMQSTGGTVGLVAGSAAIGKVDPNTATLWGILTQGSTTASELGGLMMGAVTTAAPAYTTAQTSPLSLDTTGALRVNVTAGGGTGGTSSNFSATFPSTGTAAGLEYLTTPPTLTNGQMVAAQADVNGSIKVNGGVSQSTASVPINISTATTTQLVALSAGKVIQITHWDVLASGTGNITLEYGTGSNCGTGTTAITGNYNLQAGSGTNGGAGIGPILFIPSGNALCALTSAAVGMAGSVSYLQF